MCIDRLLQAQAFLQVDLPAGRGQQISTPDYLGDTLERIVQYDGQLIGGKVVGPPNDKISDARGQVFPDDSLQTVVKPSYLMLGFDADTVRR